MCAQAMWFPGIDEPFAISILQSMCNPVGCFLTFIFVDFEG